MRNDEINIVIDTIGRCFLLRTESIKSNSYKLKAINHSYRATYLMDSELNDYQTRISGNIKYAMFVYDNSTIGENELYIIIGQNPSYSFSSNIDGTNQNIYKALLNRGIHRYLLLNTFPTINSNGGKSENLCKTRKNLYIIKQFIKKTRKKVSLKIVFACGSSLKVYAKSIRLLNRLCKKYKIQTFAFEHNGIPQCHLASHTLHKSGATPSTLVLSKYQVNLSDSHIFSTVNFFK